MSDTVASHYLEDSLEQFRKTRALADKAMAQLSDDEFFITLDAESNSVAILIKHIAGNLHSRWTDFLTSDGEKAWRHRDEEFEVAGGADPAASRARLQQVWEAGWQVLFATLEELTAADLANTVTIRGEPHTVVQAINRQLTHYAYHVGQIVFLAKHLKSANWQTLSVARGKSEEFRQQMLEKHQ